MNEEKLKLVERLIKEGAISLAEGLMLLETEKEYVPTQIQFPVFPQPFEPLYGTGAGTGLEYLKFQATC